MIPQPLTIPQGMHSAVWAALLNVLTNDPQLKAFFRTWRTWTGEPTIDNAEPATSELPWIRLTPTAAPANPTNVGQTASHLAVKVELLLAGTRITDAMDAWDAIVTALFPGDGSVLQQLSQVTVNGTPDQAGAYGYQVTQPTFGPAQLTDGVVMGGQGIVLLLINQNTLP